MTIYPGWYSGRTVHIHVQVSLGGNVVHTGQLFFPEALTDAVYKRAPYSRRPGRDTRNATDSIYRNGGIEVAAEAREERQRLCRAHDDGGQPLVGRRENWRRPTEPSPSWPPPVDPSRERARYTSRGGDDDEHEREHRRGAPLCLDGAPPARGRRPSLVDDAHRRYRDVDEGAVSEVYPALARVPPELFGICVAAVDGRVHSVGDAEIPFTIMSVAKPFTFALVCDALGPDEIQRRVGVNATGLPFNSLEAVEHAEDGRTNPMVNPGAIATASFAPGDAPRRNGRSSATGSRASPAAGSSSTGRCSPPPRRRTSAIASSQRRSGGAAGWAATRSDAVDVYTRQSCLGVTARDLALMGATLADGGVNPLTGERVVAGDTCRYVLTVMTTAGLYETSGDWLYDVGFPGKSGIGGGIVMVSPGKGGLGTFSPPLDAAGNSVRGQLVARFLSRRLGLDLFASTRRRAEPARSLRGAAAGRRAAASSRGGPRLDRDGRDHGYGRPTTIPRQAARAAAARLAPEARPRRAGGGRGLLPCPAAAARGRDRVPRAVLARAARDRARLDRRHRAAGRQPSRGGDRLDRRPAAVRRGGIERGRGRDHAAREPHERAGAALARRVLLGVHGDDGGAPERPRGGARGRAHRRPAVRAKIVDLVLVAGAGALLLASIAITVVAQIVVRVAANGRVRRARRRLGLGVLGVAVPLVIVTVVVMLLYRFVPARRLRFRDAVAGGVVTGLLLLAISAGSAFVYNQVAELSVIYGSITAVLVFLYSVYLYASAILFGAALAGAWSMPPATGPVGPAPRAGAPRGRRALRTPAAARRHSAARSRVTPFDNADAPHGGDRPSIRLSEGAGSDDRPVPVAPPRRPG